MVSMNKNDFVINVRKINEISKQESIGRMMEIMFRCLDYIDSNNILSLDGKYLGIVDISALMQIEEQAVRRSINSMYSHDMAKKISINGHKAIMFNPRVIRKTNSALLGQSSLYDEIVQVPSKRGTSYTLWRSKVLERDNYTCQCCGSRENLAAHHILNYSQYKDLQLDIDNGITLCERCHSPIIAGSFHNVYGTKNNNRRQLEEYISKYKEIQAVVSSMINI